MKVVTTAHLYSVLNGMKACLLGVPWRIRYTWGFASSGLRGLNPLSCTTLIYCENGGFIE